MRLAKVGEQAWVSSRRAAEKLRPQLRENVATWQKGGEITDSELVALIVEGDPVAIAKALMPATNNAVLLTEWEAWAAEVIAIAGVAQWSEIGIIGSFSIDNPYSAPWMLSHGGTLITQISDTTRRAIAAEVANGFLENYPPREMAKTIRAYVGLDSNRAKSLMAYEAELRAEGITGDKLATALLNRSASLIRDRSLVIARTETIDAHANGTLQSWQEGQRTGQISKGAKKVWIAAMGSERTCPICIGLDGLTAPLDGAFTGGYTSPTAHVTCRCAMGLQWDRT